MANDYGDQAALITTASPGPSGGGGDCAALWEYGMHNLWLAVNM